MPFAHLCSDCILAPRVSVLVGSVYREAWLHAVLPFPLVLAHALVLHELHLIALLL